MFMLRYPEEQVVMVYGDFDETLLQHHPSEYLRLEDKRLDTLNESTKQLWET